MLGRVYCNRISRNDAAQRAMWLGFRGLCFVRVERRRRGGGLLDRNINIS